MFQRRSVKVFMRISSRHYTHHVIYRRGSRIKKREVSARRRVERSGQNSDLLFHRGYFERATEFTA